jgi:hypothetical protein
VRGYWSDPASPQRKSREGFPLKTMKGEEIPKAILVPDDENVPKAIPVNE